jgi:acyl carrier protein
MATPMNCVDVLQEIVSRFAPKRAKPLHLNRGTHLLNEAAIDSPRMIDVILEIEDRFQLTLADEEVQNVRTFGDLVNMVESRTAEAAT